MNKGEILVDDFKPIIKKAIQQLINEKIGEKLQNVLKNEEQIVPTKKVQSIKIKFSKEKKESLMIIKELIKDCIEEKRISTKDNESIFEIDIENNSQKWICKINFDESSIYINLPTKEKEYMKRKIRELSDIYFYKNHLCEVVNKLKRG